MTFPMDKAEEAKSLHEQVRSFVEQSAFETDKQSLTVMIYAGLIVETLLEYEEPDAVMEQLFHRLSELLGVIPQSGEMSFDDLPAPYIMDSVLEQGRKLARDLEERLPGGLDDVHEVALALIISDFPAWEDGGNSSQKNFRLLVESVIAGLVTEIAVQELCDYVIEELVTEYSLVDAVTSLAAVSGVYIKETSGNKHSFVDSLVELCTSEKNRYQEGRGPSESWVANDDMPEIRETKAVDGMEAAVAELYADLDMTYPEVGAMALAKAVGRMLAVISFDEASRVQAGLAENMAHKAFYDFSK